MDTFCHLGKKRRMPTWADRAQHRMKQLGLSQADLTDALGVTTRGAVGHYFTGRRNMSIKKFLALARALECSVYWLVEGSEEEELDAYNPLTRNELFLLNSYRSLNSPARELVDDYLNKLVRICRLESQLGGIKKMAALNNTADT